MPEKLWHERLKDELRFKWNAHKLRYFGSEEKRIEAVDVLEKYGKRAVPNLIEAAARHSQDKVRARAITALGNIGDKRAIDLLGRTISDVYHVETRMASLAALKKIGGKEVIPKFVDALGCQFVAIYEGATTALIDMGGEDVVNQLKKRYFELGKDRFHQSVVESALLRMGVDMTRDLIKAHEIAPDESGRDSIEKRIKDIERFKKAVAELEHDDYARRAHAILELSEFGEPGIKLIEKALRNPDEEEPVKAVAVQKLGGMTESYNYGDKALQALIRAHEEADERMQKWIENELEEIDKKLPDQN